MKRGDETNAEVLGLSAMLSLEAAFSTVCVLGGHTRNVQESKELKAIGSSIVHVLIALGKHVSGGAQDNPMILLSDFLQDRVELVITARAKGPIN